MPRLLPLLFALALLVSVDALAAPAATEPVVALLCYHDLSDDPSAPDYTLSPDSLRAHIRRARAEGWRFLSLSDVRARAARPKTLPPRTLVVTFDDGYRSFLERALPILRAEGVPATVCVVTSWVDRPPAGLPPLLTWPEIRRLDRDPLVEIAAHSHALHGYVTCDPAGDTAPAATTRLYLPEPARYETRDEYRRRVVADLDSAQARLTAELGHAVRVLAWPYGERNEVTASVARAAGFGVTLGLEGENAPLDSIRRGVVPRTMVYRDTRVGAADLLWLYPPRREPAAAFVSLDDVYDPDAATLASRVDLLGARLIAAGVRRVVLSTCSDPAGDGFLARTWFANHQTGVRADIWSLVAYRLRAGGLEVWAKAPALNLSWVWAQHPEWRVAAPVQPLGTRAAAGYFRLRPEADGAVSAARDFFTDLAVYLPVTGVVFDDDAFLTAEERPSDPSARRDAIRAYLESAKAAIRAWRPACRFGRLLHASVLDARAASPRFGQDLDESLTRDDWSVIETDPPSVGSGSAWAEGLARSGAARRRGKPGTLSLAFPAAGRAAAAWVAGARAGGSGAALVRPAATEESLLPGLFPPASPAGLSVAP